MVPVALTAFGTSAPPTRLRQPIPHARHHSRRPPPNLLDVSGRSLAPHPGRGGLIIGGRGGGHVTRIASPHRSEPALAPTDADVVKKRGPAVPLKYREHNKLESLLLQVFTKSMEEEVGFASDKPGYEGMIEAAHVLNRRKDMREASLRIYQKLFSNKFVLGFLGFFPPIYSVIPRISDMMVAVVCSRATEWLVGPSKVIDVERPDGTVAKNAGVKIEQCRYLTESGCASVCVNTCKAPAQVFFKDVMDLDVMITPNYDDFSCQFSFGQEPLPEALDEAFKTPCFGQCPSKAWHRKDALLAQGGSKYDCPESADPLPAPEEIEWPSKYN